MAAGSLPYGETVPQAFTQDRFNKGYIKGVAVFNQ